MNLLFKALMLALLLAGTPRAGASQIMVMLNLPAPHYRADATYSGSYRHDSGRIARRRIAQELAAGHGLTLVSDWPMPLLGVDCYVMALPAGANAGAIALALGADKRVEWTQPVSQFRTLATGDPLYPVQPVAARWRLGDLHRAATGRAVTVAVIDSGVDERHPDLAGQVALTQNFIEGQAYQAEHHGTAVAGIIGALSGNGIGIRGVAPGARLLALRACREPAGASAQCDSFSLGKALHFAIVHDARIINLSLTGPADRLLQRLLDAALTRGIAVVGAADPGSGDGGFPASWPGVVSVGAQAAPGHDIPTTLPAGRFGMVSGSSYASAHVSGLLALMGELRPRASAAERHGYLRGTQGKASAAAPIDACAALAQAAGNCVCACSAATASAAIPASTARLP